MTTAPSLQYALELLGTVLFASSGAIRATEKSRPDWLGVTFVGFVTAIGGGSLRDMLLGHYPLGWVRDPNYLYAIFGGIVLARIAYAPLMAFRRERLSIEALGMGMFAVLGAEKALHYGAPAVVAAVLGMFSAVMGGVIRDTLTNREPVIFSREIYATACIAGAALFVLLERLGAPRDLNLCAGTLLTFALRIAALRFRWSLPAFPLPSTPPPPRTMVVPSFEGWQRRSRVVMRTRTRVDEDRKEPHAKASDRRLSWWRVRQRRTRAAA
ncbi:MAG: trimeric intracellular cation channel family protein [Flavobacteriales bacterium]|nr:trimeric intracellular cation channel family protein [Flavobacteriales bacterium]